MPARAVPHQRWKPSGAFNQVAYGFGAEDRVLSAMKGDSLFDGTGRSFVPIGSTAASPVASGNFVVIFLPLLRIVNQVSVGFMAILFTGICNLFNDVRHSLPLFPIVDLIGRGDTIKIFGIKVGLAVPVSWQQNNVGRRPDLRDRNDEENDPISLA